jgi:shikimate dehydrogenase
MRAAVLGSPIAHSLSPVLHRAAYAYLGLDWDYDARVCDEAALPALLAALGPEWAGVSLTMPLKTAVLALLDEVDPVARQSAAANTVVLRQGRRLGFNTDVPGMVAALAERGVRPGGPAAVLGGGATARSAVLAVAQAGWTDIVVYSRRPVTLQWQRAALPEEMFLAGVRLAGADLSLGHVSASLRSDLVVSTLPRGVSDAFTDQVPGGLGTLFDVLYDPWPTPLATAWAERGGAVIGGLDLLVHQAALQVVLMTGATAPVADLVAVMRPAGQAALDARQG